MDPALRRSLYSLMLVAAAGLMVGRIANVELVYEPSVYAPRPNPYKPGETYGRTWPASRPDAWPTLSSNDKARWATVKALVENHTFVIGHREPNPDNPRGYDDPTGILAQEGPQHTKGYGSVDVVMNPDTHDFYATKPPLLTIFVAGQYWVLHRVFHKDMDTQKWEVVVPILIVTNVLPLLIALWLLSQLLEAYGRTDWGRLFVFATACFGTFLPTFAITLNNHVPAACCVMFATYAIIAPTGRRADPPYFVPGEVTDGTRSPVRIIIAGVFAGLAACTDLPAAAFAGVVGLIVLLQSPRGLVWFLPAVVLAPAAQSAINYEAFGTWQPIYAKFGGPWYEFAGSHWSKIHNDPREPGIDFIDEPKEVYAFNFLVGHHGLFSLTPIWLLALLGMAFPLRGSLAASRLHRLSFLILIVVVGFYIWKTNNYGGWSSGPRWLFWLTPLLLLALVPVADRLAASRAGRALAYFCLAVSAFSAAYPWTNPWRMPWIYQWAEYMGWVQY
jgi:hypothetical protein